MKLHNFCQENNAPPVPLDAEEAEKKREEIEKWWEEGKILWNAKTKHGRRKDLETSQKGLCLTQFLDAKGNSRPNSRKRAPRERFSSN